MEYFVKLTTKEEKDYSLKLSDEELLRMCDGLTAHKYVTTTIDFLYLCIFLTTSLCFYFRGARHGLTASGKLARIAKQEALMLASLNSDKKPAYTDLKVEVASEIKVKKEKKRKRKAAVDAPDTELTETKEEQDSLTVLIPEHDTPEEMRPKKKKKKSKNSTQEWEDQSITTESCELATIIEEDQPIEKTEKRKKKKKRTENDAVEPLLVQEEEDISISEPKKKKKKKNKHQNVWLARQYHDYYFSKNSLLLQ